VLAFPRISSKANFINRMGIGRHLSMTSDLSRAISSTAYQTYEKRLMKEVLAMPVPHHVAIIMDGNRRYAKDFGMIISEGHDKGRQKLEDVLEWCMDIGVKMLTVYAFSTENVGRSKGEVDTLMRMFVQNFRRLGDDDRVHKNKIRVKVLGQRDLLPKDLQEAIEYAEEKTKDYNNYFFNLAVGYGGREEIVQGIKKVAQAVKQGELKVEDINEKTFSKFLYTKDMPDPDLILRTSGEERISNFLLWQLAYSELYFSDIYWPGFRKIDFLRAVRSYQLRKRRFGS
jgi:tritrans,polycis-undecaprenyl-diphosphate synthase [geranylgeranyl-diphosphate specific]